MNNNALKRLQKLLLHGNIIFGGKIDEEDKYISPTIIDNVQHDFPIMQEEIFGPILPVMTFKNIEEVISYVNSHEKPLAFYYFGSNDSAKNIFAENME